MSGRLARASRLRTRPSDVGRVWGVLSAELSEIAFRYAEGVGVRCFPEASAPAPGCCYLEAGTILLDGNMISEPSELAVTSMAAKLREELAVLMGVLLHECGHGNHSKLAVTAAAHEAGVQEEVALLEEPRMERRLCGVHPIARRFIRCAVRAINVPNLPGAGEALTRAHAAHIGVVVLGRENAGTLPPEVAGLTRDLVEAGLGTGDAERLRVLVERACRIADGDAEAMVAAGKELRDLIGPDEGGIELPAALAAALRELIEEVLGEAARKAAEEVAGEGEKGGGEGEELAEAREALEELAARASEELEEKGPKWISHGLSSDGGFRALPGGPPGSAERSAARRMESALRRVRARRTAREGSRVPGRFHSRRAMRGDADRARGVCKVPEPYVRRVEVKERLWAPEIGVAIDTSGSMGVHEEVLAQVLWVSAKAVRGIGGRFCAVGFGDCGELILGPGDALATVPQFDCSGGTERFDLGAEILESNLRFGDRRRPRLLVIVSDGQWCSHVSLSEAALERIRAAGVATLHVDIGGMPREHGAERVGSIPDALSLGEVLGEECRRALEKRA